MLERDVKGLDALLRELQTVPEKVRRNVLRGGVRVAGTTIKKAVLAEYDAKMTTHRKRKSRLRESIKLSTSMKGGNPSAALYTRTWYAHFIERGTGTHRNKGMFAGTVNPGIKAKPFFRTGFDKAGEAAIDRARDWMFARMSKEGYAVPDPSPDESEDVT